MLNFNKYILLHSARPPWPYKLMLNEATWRIQTKEKIVYLTFDDGPTPEITDKVLDILANYKVKATFFCLGKNVLANKGLFQRVKNEGHKIGNHSFSHPDGWNTSNKKYYSDIEEGNKLIKSTIFRPPYGKLSITQYNYLKTKYKIIMWDILTGDYNPKLNSELCFNTIKRKVRPGSIIVFHDSIKAAPQMIEALEMSLIWLKNQGYSLDTL